MKIKYFFVFCSISNFCSSHRSLSFHVLSSLETLYFPITYICFILEKSYLFRLCRQHVYICQHFVMNFSSFRRQAIWKFERKRIEKKKLVFHDLEEKFLQEKRKWKVGSIKCKIIWVSTSDDAHEYVHTLIVGWKLLRYCLAYTLVRKHFFPSLSETFPVAFFVYRIFISFTSSFFVVFQFIKTFVFHFSFPCLLTWFLHSLSTQAIILFHYTKL